MPKILNNYDPAVGPLVDVAIFRDPDTHQGGNDPGLAFRALIDTGATVTCISRRVIDLCRLIPSGSIVVSGATGSANVNYFEFGIGLLVPMQGKGEYEAKITPILRGPEFSVAENPPYQVLLGRDVICRGEFHISKNGTFELDI